MNRNLFFLFCLMFYGYTCLVGWGCQGNVSLLSEARIPDFVVGVTRCEKDFRTPTGTTGETRFRLAVIDDAGEPIPLSLLRTALERIDFLDLFSIRPGSVRVRSLDRSSGPSEEVSATLTWQPTRPGWIQENPWLLQVQEDTGNLRPAIGLQVLLDMSEASAQQDPSMYRTVGLTSLLFGLNERLFRGALDAFGVQLLRGDRLLTEDNLFLPFEAERQWLSEEGRKRGLILTTENNKQRMIRELLKLSNVNTRGRAPLYEGIREGATQLRDVAFSSTGRLQKLSALVALSMSLDVHQQDPQAAPDRWQEAQKALAGSQGQALPLMAIAPYEAPQGTTQEVWDGHLDRLCQLSRVARAEDSTATFGQLLLAPPWAFPGSSSSEPAYLQELIKRTRELLPGWLEVGLQYELTGARAGQRYLIEFAVDIKLRERDTREQALRPSRLLSFVVQVP